MPSFCSSTQHIECPVQFGGILLTQALVIRQGITRLGLPPDIEGTVKAFRFQIEPEIGVEDSEDKLSQDRPFDPTQSQAILGGQELNKIVIDKKCNQADSIGHGDQNDGNR